MNPDEALARAGFDPEYVADIIDRALAEDLDGGVDVTSVATVDAGARGTLDLVARAPGVISGAPVAAAALVRASQGRVTCTWIEDGTTVSAGDVVVSASGPTRDLLLGERTALNLLCHLSGIATATRHWVDALGDSTTRVRDHGHGRRSHRPEPCLASLRLCSPDAQTRLVECGRPGNVEVSL